MRIKFELNIDYERDDRPPGQTDYSDNFSETLEIPDKLDDDGTLGFDRKSFGEVIFHLYLLAFTKSVEYGDSWQKRGEIRGPISNMDRKYDRIMNSIERWISTGKNDPWARIDGSADLAVYTLLYLSTFLKEHYPEDYKRWWHDELQAYIDRYRPLRSVTKETEEGLPAPKVA
jgi:hypothetical protein